MDNELEGRQFKLTTATKKLIPLCHTGNRIKAIAGGTSAGKTISILQILMDKAMTEKGLLISIVSESLPHLKRGAMRDFIAIMESHGYFKEAHWNRSDYIYTFPTGSKIEFFGVDSPDKVRGPRRDILFMNEANNCPYESFDQLEVRTKQEIWLDWNPTSEFWFYTDILPFREDLDFETLTYLDNEALDNSIVKSIEARKHNKSWWLVYGLGQLGEVGGRIYTGWGIVDSVPHEARLERRGLDFGYSNDPAVLVDLYYYNGGYIFDELLYRTKMSNARVADYINNTESPNILCIADSAEPKSIDELAEHGVNVIGAEKGPGSRNRGILYLQDQKVSITKRSVNLIKSYRNYMWKFDKNGHQTTEPDHNWSDGMDACLVKGTKVMTNNGALVSIEKIKKGDYVLTRKGYKKVLSAGITGKNKPLYELTTQDGNKLVGTGNHPIWANNKWKELRDIRYADKLLTWSLASDIKNATTTSTQSLNNFTAGSTTITVERVSYTESFMQIILGLYRKVCTFITKTTTRMTTALRTLSFLRKSSTANATGKNENQSKRSATPVQPSLATRTAVSKIGFVPINASLDGVEAKGLITRPDDAYIASQPTQVISTQKIATVPVLAQTVRELKRKADVYNLEVEGAHEYFANGILVHNCRYAMESMRPKDYDLDPLGISTGNAESLWI